MAVRITHAVSESEKSQKKMIKFQRIKKKWYFNEMLRINIMGTIMLERQESKKEKYF